MKLFLLNVLLAVLWMGMWGSFDVYTMFAGLLLGYLLLGLISRTLTGHGYGRKVWDVMSFAIYFVRILVKANFQVARIVLHPALPIAPRIIRYEVSDLTPVQLTTLANSITLTPGTLVVEVSPDAKWLYIHSIDAGDRDAMVRDLDELRGRLMQEVFA